MSSFKFASGIVLRTPKDRAEYFRLDAEWIRDVTAEMDWETFPITDPMDAAYEALAADRTDISDAGKRLIGAELVGDAYWVDPVAQWAPLTMRWYLELVKHITRHQWLSVADQYVDTDAFDTPSYRGPDAFKVDGRNPTRYVNRVRDRIAMAAAVLHTDWYVYVMDEIGAVYDRKLAMQATDAMVAYTAGEREMLPTAAAKLQRIMYRKDADWLAEFFDTHGVDSTILRITQDICDRAADDLSKMV